MKFDEFQDLDPEDVAAQCGRTDSADRGPYSGMTGESEAEMAEEGVIQYGNSEPDDSGGSRSHQLTAGDLTARLITADPSLDEAEALSLLEEILNDERGAEQQPIVLRSASQFVPAWLSTAVDSCIANYLAEQASDALSAPIETVADLNMSTDDADMAAAEAEAGIHVDVPESEPYYFVQLHDEPGLSDDEPLSLVEVIARAKQELLPVARRAYEHLRAHREHDAKAVADELAALFWAHAYAVYRTADWDDERITAQLCKGRDGQIITDPKQMRFAWFQRTAHAMFRQETKTPEQFLAEFRFPGLSQRKPAPAPQSDNQEVSSDKDLPDVAGDTAWADGGDALPPADEVEPVVIEPGSIVVDEVDGRRRVSRGDLPTPTRHTVSGGRSKPSTEGSVHERLDALCDSLAATVDDAATDDSDVETPASDESPLGGATGGRERSDESVLANLPDEVVQAAIDAVLADSDPDQCWAFRTPEAVRVEADKRLLLEYGQSSAA